MLLLADFGDKTTIYFSWFAETVRLPPLYNSYKEAGEYYATFWARNANSSVNIRTQVLVDAKIKGTISVSSPVF